MKFEFDEKNHYYTLDGKRMYGVTTVLSVIAKPALIAWSAGEAVKYLIEHGEPYYGANNDLQDHYIIDGEMLAEAKVAHRKKKESAGEKGTEAHALIEELIKLGIKLTHGRIAEHILFKEDANELVKAQVNNFIYWANKNNIQFLASEKRLYSKEMWVAGTTDMIFIKDGKKFVGDIKTSSAIYPEHFYQMAAYRMMLEEMGEDHFEGSVVIRLGKDGKFNENKDVQYRYDYITDKSAFLGALAIFKAGESWKGL